MVDKAIFDNEALPKDFFQPNGVRMSIILMGDVTLSVHLRWSYLVQSCFQKTKLITIQINRNCSIVV